MRGSPLRVRVLWRKCTDITSEHHMAIQDLLIIAKKKIMYTVFGLTDCVFLSVYVCLYLISNSSMGKSFIRMFPPDLNIQPIRVSAGIPPYISPAPVPSTPPHQTHFTNWNFTTILQHFSGCKIVMQLSGEIM